MEYQCLIETHAQAIFRKRLFYKSRNPNTDKQKNDNPTSMMTINNF